jgi:sterol desaturase/sphingolipid hydroxylase (fatty acid hydroxylase superfamily)
MGDYFYSCQWFEVMAIGIAFFAALYFGFGTLNYLLIRHILPAISYGATLDNRVIGKGQIARELRQSSVSILIFGAGLIVPWELLHLGWAKFATQAYAWQIALEIFVLVMWNEIHFYLNHRLLHLPWLRRFHVPHHRSIVTTPWSSYSFHPLETMLLGNVILLPMCLHDFSFYSLMSVPIFSIIFNNIGHSNYDFLPDAKHDRWWLNGARRHHLHHACYHGNYGFMFPFMDRILCTELTSDAADAKIGKGVKQHVA